MKKSAFLKIGVVIMAALFCLQSQALAEADPFEAYADELITTIERSVGLTQKVMLEMGMDKVSVAVRPFPAADLPVPQDMAAGWNEKLRSALIRKNPGYLRMVSRADLAALLKETETINAFEEGGNVTEALARKAKVRFLIIGKIRPAPGGVELFYECHEVETGHIVAASEHRRFAIDPGREKALTVDAAITQAAKDIAGRDLGMEILERDSLRDGYTKSVPPFSDFFLKQLAAEIERQISSTHVGYKLKMRGMLARPPVKAASDDCEARSCFKLSGSYWVSDNHIDVLVEVRNGLGEYASWNGRIGRDYVSNDMILVDNNAAPDEEDIPQDDTGPMGLKLSTNMGAHPRFRLGETMKLYIEVKQDAYLNCYYRQADGVALRFFPNRYMSTDNKVMAGELNILPRSDRISFTMKEPEGEEKLHCFATDKPVASKLPAALATDLTPIQPADFRNLSAAFQSIPDIRLSEASMTVTVRD